MGDAGERSRSGAWKRWLPVLAVVVVVQASVSGIYWIVETRGERGAPFVVERVPSSPPLPPIALDRADGSALALADMRGRPVLLHFWATWCPPCRDELPALLAFGRARADIAVVAVAVDDDWQKVRAFLGGDVPPEIVREPRETLIARYGVGALPDTYLFDGDGRARVRMNGARDWRGDGARDAIDAALRKE